MFAPLSPSKSSAATRTAGGLAVLPSPSRPSSGHHTHKSPARSPSRSPSRPTAAAATAPLSPTGDRFIPNRASTDYDYAHHELTTAPDPENPSQGSTGVGTGGKGKGKGTNTGAMRAMNHMLTAVLGGVPAPPAAASSSSSSSSAAAAGGGGGDGGMNSPSRRGPRLVGCFAGMARLSMP